MIIMKTIVIDDHERTIQYEDEIEKELKEIHGLDFIEETKKLLEKKNAKNKLG